MRSLSEAPFNIQSLITLLDALYSVIHSLKNAVMVLPVTDAQGNEDIVAELSYCFSAENVEAIRSYGRAVQSLLKQLAGQQSQVESALANFPPSLSEEMNSTIATLLQCGPEVTERIDRLTLHAKRFAALDAMPSEEREAFPPYAKAHLDALYDLLTDDAEGLLRCVSHVLEPFEVGSIVTAAARPVLARAQALGVKVEIPSVSKRARLVGDPEPLTEVLDGLLSNALDAVVEQARVAPEGYGGEIRVAVQESDGTVEMRITDNGCGLPPERLERIRHGERITSKGDGRGNGLPSARQRLNVYTNASLEIESEGIGKGACAVVRLNLASPVSAPTGAFFFERVRQRVWLYAAPLLLTFAIMYWLATRGWLPQGVSWFGYMLAWVGIGVVVGYFVAKGSNVQPVSLSGSPGQTYVGEVATVKGLDVRLVLFTAGLVLASLALKPWEVFNAFGKSMGNVDTIGPICSAMGYAFVLRAIGADQEMVRLLLPHIRRLRWLLVPGGCVVGFLTNMAITSQTAAAAVVGPILVPLMLAVGYHPIVVGATLVLGCSVGGSLYNPGEADIKYVADNAGVSISHVVDMVFLPELLGSAAAIVAFTLLSRRQTHDVIQMPPSVTANEGKPINYVKVILLLLPTATVVLLHPKFHLFPPLLRLYPDGLPISHAMLASAVIALLVHHKEFTAQTRTFFEGMGFAYVNVISIIIAAKCFITGIEAIGLTPMLVSAYASSAFVGKSVSVVFPWMFGVVSGSGTATIEAFARAVLPALSATNRQGAVDVGVLATIAATFGRTMSPVAAVVIFTSMLVGVTPMQIVKRTAPALAVGAVVVFVVMLLRA